MQLWVLHTTKKPIYLVKFIGKHLEILIKTVRFFIQSKNTQK